MFNQMSGLHSPAKLTKLIITLVKLFVSVFMLLLRKNELSFIYVYFPRVSILISYMEYLTRKKLLELLRYVWLHLLSCLFYILLIHPKIFLNSRPGMCVY